MHTMKKYYIVVVEGLNRTVTYQAELFYGEAQQIRRALEQHARKNEIKGFTITELKNILWFSELQSALREDIQ